MPPGIRDSLPSSKPTPLQALRIAVANKAPFTLRTVTVIGAEDAAGLLAVIDGYGLESTNEAVQLAVINLAAMDPTTSLQKQVYKKMTREVERHVQRKIAEKMHEIEQELVESIVVFGSDH